MSVCKDYPTYTFIVFPARGSTLKKKLELYLKEKIISELAIIKVKSIPSISTSTSTLLPLVNSIGL